MTPALCSSTRTTAVARTPSSTTVTTAFQALRLGRRGLRRRAARFGAGSLTGSGCGAGTAWGAAERRLDHRYCGAVGSDGCRGFRSRRARGDIPHDDLEVVERPALHHQRRHRAVAAEREDDAVGALLDLPPRNPVPAHVLRGPARAPHVDAFERQRDVEDVGIALPLSRQDRDAPDVVVVVAVTGLGSAAGPRQLA